MGCGRGLPQGLSSSDALATVYLSRLDFCMVREGFRYARYGDDIRVGVKSYDDGRKAVECIEKELRGLGLLLNASKTLVLRRTTYEKEMALVDDAEHQAGRKVVKDKTQHLMEDADKLAKTLEDAGMEQLAWDHLYHGHVDFEEVIERLPKNVLSPSSEELAEEVFNQAVKLRPGQVDGLDIMSFRRYVKWSLVRLSAARSAVALPKMSELIQERPEMMGNFCSYLQALSSVDPPGVAAQVEKSIQDRYTSEWEMAHLVRVLRKVAASVSERTLRFLGEKMTAPHGE